MAKKALIIALLMVFACAAQAMAQKPDKKAAPKPASEQLTHREAINFGERWQGMGEETKRAFLEGMASAFRIVCLNSVTSLDSKPADVKDVNKRFMECMVSFFPFQINQVQETMTDLYQDKANTIIAFDDMYYQALLKIKGDPIDDNLKQLRQKMEKLSKQSQ
jgi:hypothetical protein